MSTEKELITCPISPVLELFIGKWKIEILWHLGDKPKRFNQLRRLIPRASQKIIAQQLRQLERDGLVTRTHYPEIPPRVEYERTDLAKSLIPIFEAIEKWGEGNGIISTKSK